MHLHGSRTTGIIVVLLLASAALAQIHGRPEPALAPPLSLVYTTGPGPSATSVYTTFSSGRLAPLAGSPFPTTGTLLGVSAPGFLLTFDAASSSPGTANIYVYALSSSGGVGSLLSTTSTLLYSSSPCSGQIEDAELSSAGGASFVYALFGSNYDGDGEGCANYQIYTLGSGGELTYTGTTELGDEIIDLPVLAASSSASSASSSAPTFAFAFGLQGDGDEFSFLSGFSLQSGTGVLTYLANNLANTSYSPVASPAADSLGHLACVVEADADVGGAYELAAFSISSSGGLSSTNSAAEMPQLPGDWPNATDQLSMNPAGTVLALAVGTGVQAYRFAGGAPLVPFAQGVVGSSGWVEQMAWDASGHLYALNGASGKLHVYSLAGAGPALELKELPGSPTEIGMSPVAVRSLTP
jgi:hypothetical protein